MPPPNIKKKTIPSLMLMISVQWLCASSILQGQFLRSAAGFLVNVFTAKDV